jgi:rhodanese-related sulfurtransferase
MNDFNMVSPLSLNSLVKPGKQIHLVDVRTPAEYRSGHVSGAISIPLDELDPKMLREQLGDTQAGHARPLYLTCQSGIRARQAADRLRQSGFENLYLLEGGTEAWMKAGLPVQRCGHAISLERQVQIAIGTLLVLKVLFGFTVHELFFAVIPLIGAGLIAAGITRWCGMARLLAMMPWNRRTDCSGQVNVYNLNSYKGEMS